MTASCLAHGRLVAVSLLVFLKVQSFRAGGLDDWAMHREKKPMIALAMGDPAGIGAELAAKLLADGEVREAADILLLGDRRVWALMGLRAGRNRA